MVEWVREVEMRLSRPRTSHRCSETEVPGRIERVPG